MIYCGRVFAKWVCLQRDNWIKRLGPEKPQWILYETLFHLHYLQYLNWEQHPRRTFLKSVFICFICFLSFSLLYLFLSAFYFSSALYVLSVSFSLFTIFWNVQKIFLLLIVGYKRSKKSKRILYDFI